MDSQIVLRGQESVSKIVISNTFSKESIELNLVYSHLVCAVKIGATLKKMLSPFNQAEFFVNNQWRLQDFSLGRGGGDLSAKGLNFRKI